MTHPRLYSTVDAPNAPGAPVVEDTDKDSVKLAWNPPLRDGGSKITGYIIEKKTPDGDWEKAANLPAGTTSARVGGLEPNGLYEFRVCAVNAAGPGDSSAPSELTKVAPKKSTSPFLCQCSHGPFVPI